MSKKWLWLYIFWLLGYWWLGIKINYPASLEQVELGGSVNGWRFISMCLLLVSLWIWKNILKRERLVSLTPYFTFFLISSPLIFGAVWTRPLEIIKLTLFSILVYSIKNKITLATIVLVFLVIANWQNISPPPILESINLERSRLEVAEKFSREDTLTEKIDLPLWFRRIAYNKYSLALKESVKNIISFWDLPGWFFQEVSPMGKKSLPIFFWPGLLMVIIGIYHSKKNKKIKDYSKKMLIFAWVYFLLFNLPENWRHLMIVWPLLLLMSFGVTSLKKKIYLFGLMAIYGYGISTMVYDLAKRPDFWLDNRPIVFDKILKAEIGLEKKYWISNRIGNAQKFCKYQLGNICNSDRYIFSSFDNREEELKGGYVYAGFEGEFLGKDFKNVFPENSLSLIEGKGFRIIKSFNIRDTVAYGYGNRLVIAEKI